MRGAPLHLCCVSIELVSSWDDWRMIHVEAGCDGGFVASSLGKVSDVFMVARLGGNLTFD
jgi:hypothetical protein